MRRQLCNQYKGEIGTNLITAKMILQNLNQSNWLDENTISLFFEQTYFNGSSSLVGI